MGFGRITLPSNGPIRGQYFFLMAKSQSFYRLSFSKSISGDFASHVIEIIMLVNLEYTLTQTRIEFGRVNVSSKGPIRDQYVIVKAK